MQADFEAGRAYADSGASAVVIADQGITTFEATNKGWFSLIHKRKRRIRILDKNGFDAATEYVYLNTQPRKVERLQNLKAVTYNLDGIRIQSTTLDAASVFTEKLSDDFCRKKFTLPAVKAGSIIEISYDVVSDYLFSLRPWTFQTEHPVLWSQCRVEIPQFFYYVFLQQGYFPIENSQSTNHRIYHVLEPSSDISATGLEVEFSSAVLISAWTAKKLPAARPEKFISSINNHLLKIEFQLAQYRFPDMVPQNVYSDWNESASDLMKNEYFGQPLRRDNSWLNGQLAELDLKEKTTLEKAKAIYAYVRDRFTVNASGSVFTSNSPSTVFQKKTGSVAEINLLMILMLNHEGVTAHPVILSTRENGYVQKDYPLLRKYNYVIAQVMIGEKDYFVDASKKLGFGLLDGSCYNGCAWKISSDNPQPLYFFTDSLKEQSMTSVFISNQGPGKQTGRFTQTYGMQESSKLRHIIKNSEPAEFVKALQNQPMSYAQFLNFGVDSVNKPEHPLAVHVDMQIDYKNAKHIYFDPIQSGDYKINPLSANSRKYPVEFPYALDNVYLLNVDVPEGYVVDELPKPIRMRFDEIGGYFEYSVGLNGKNRVQLIRKIVLKRTIFRPEEYEALRAFFSMVVMKQNEQFVFRKAD